MGRYFRNSCFFDVLVWLRAWVLLLFFVPPVPHFAYHLFSALSYEVPLGGVVHSCPYLFFPAVFALCFTCLIALIYLPFVSSCIRLAGPRMH